MSPCFASAAFRELLDSHAAARALFVNFTPLLLGRSLAADTEGAGEVATSASTANIAVAPNRRARGRVAAGRMVAFGGRGNRATVAGVRVRLREQNQFTCVPRKRGCFSGCFRMREPTNILLLLVAGVQVQTLCRKSE